MFHIFFFYFFFFSFKAAPGSIGNSCWELGPGLGLFLLLQSCSAAGPHELNCNRLHKPFFFVQGQELLPSAHPTLLQRSLLPAPVLPSIVWAHPWGQAPGMGVFLGCIWGAHPRREPSSCHQDGESRARGWFGARGAALSGRRQRSGRRRGARGESGCWIKNKISPNSPSCTPRGDGANWVSCFQAMGRAGTATPSISWGGAGGFPSWDGAAGCCGHHLGGKGSSLAPIWGVGGAQKGAGGLCQEETAPSSAEQPRAAGGREKTAPVRVNKHLPTARLGLFFCCFFLLFYFPFRNPCSWPQAAVPGLFAEGVGARS